MFGVKATARFCSEVQARRSIDALIPTVAFTNPLRMPPLIAFIRLSYNQKSAESFINEINKFRADIILAMGL